MWRWARKNRPGLAPAPTPAPLTTPTAPSWQDTPWCELCVGDLVLLSRNEIIPADILILSTSEPEGQCFLETKNLDGETNLKVKLAPHATQWIADQNDAAIFRALIQADLPNNQLQAFHGVMQITKDMEEGGSTATLPTDAAAAAEAVDEVEMIPLSIANLLLRGCVLRNTSWVIGVLVYTGGETKIVQNTGLTPSKRSRIERQLNPQIILCFVVLFAMCLVCACVQGSLVNGPISKSPFWTASFGASAFASGAYTGFLTFWSCLLLFQTLVPISLYIAVEICKTVQAYFIYSDREMYDPVRDRRGCIPRAWNLADDLGHIDYLFTDKTGTLTENVMEWRMASIAGKVYGTFETDTDEPALTVPASPSDAPPVLHPDPLDNAVQLFFTIVTTCHTVLTEVLADADADDLGKEPQSQGEAPVPAPPAPIIYKAQSPDEAALVKTARHLGFSLVSRTPEELVLDFHGRTQRWRLLQTIEFTSARKRMSVIAQNQGTGEIWLFCKGADNVILDLLKHGDALLGSTLQHVQQFAEQGLTLFF